MAISKKVSVGDEADESIGARVRERTGRGEQTERRVGTIPALVIRQGQELSAALQAMFDEGTASNAVHCVTVKPPRPIDGKLMVAYHTDKPTGPWHTAIYGNPRGGKVGKITVNLYDPNGEEAQHADGQGPEVSFEGTVAKAVRQPVRAPAPKKEAPLRQPTMEGVSEQVDHRPEKDFHFEGANNPIHNDCGGAVNFETGVCDRCERRVNGWLTKEEKEAEEAKRQKGSVRREQPISTRAPAPTHVEAPKVNADVVSKLADALVSVAADNRAVLMVGQPAEVVAAVEKAIVEREEALKPVVAEVRLDPEIPAGAAVLQVKEFGTNRVPCTLIEVSPGDLLGEEREAWRVFTESHGDILAAAALLNNDFNRLLGVVKKRGEYRVFFPRVIKTASPIPRADADAWTALKKDPSAIAELMNGDAVSPDRLLSLLTLQAVTEWLVPVKKYPKGLTTPEAVNWAYAQEGHTLQEVAVKMGGDARGEPITWLQSLAAAQRIMQAEVVEESIDVTPKDFGIGVTVEKPAANAVQPVHEEAELVFGRFPWAESGALRPLAEQLGLPMEDSQHVRDLAGYAGDQEMPTGKAMKGLTVLAALMTTSRITVEGIVEAWQKKQLGQFITASNKQAEAVSLFMDVAAKLAAERPTAAAQHAGPAPETDFSSLSVTDLRKCVRDALDQAEDKKYARDHFSGYSSAKHEQLVEMLNAWAKVLAQA